RLSLQSGLDAGETLHGLPAASRGILRRTAVGEAVPTEHTLRRVAQADLVTKLRHVVLVLLARCRWRRGCPLARDQLLCPGDHLGHLLHPVRAGAGLPDGLRPELPPGLGDTLGLLGLVLGDALGVIADATLGGLARLHRLKRDA